MNWLDYSLVALYMVSMVVLGRLFINNREGSDYFLGGRSFGWFSLCMSAMATQLSVISFVSAPAFVGLREGGGMKWLTFEFGVPIAMLIIMTIIAPALYKSKVVSIYSYLEKRFDTRTRMLLSAAFMFNRSFAASVTIYTVCLILSSLLHLPFNWTMALVGVTTILYSLEGGMKAVVYSEVIQMIIKVAGIFVIMYFALGYLGGWNEFVQQMDTSRLTAVNYESFGFSGDEYGFWPMLFGGIFLYTSYYGTDQIMAQRILSAKDLPTARKVLLFNGLLRFPITFSYCLGGLILGTFVLKSNEFASKIPLDAAGKMKTDLMVPIFIEHYLPHGIIGVIVVAIIAAAMSAYSSTLNSLSAVTMEEFLNRDKSKTDQQYIRYSKGVALVWGIFTMVVAFFVGDLSKTVIETINKMGSVFYGPILGVFLLATLTRRTHATAANAGLVVGVLFNFYLWKMQPQIFWFWWNLIGCALTISLGMLISRFLPALQKQTDKPDIDIMANIRENRSAFIILLLFFALIVGLSTMLPSILR